MEACGSEDATGELGDPIAIAFVDPWLLLAPLLLSLSVGGGVCGDEELEAGADGSGDGDDEGGGEDMTGTRVEYSEESRRLRHSSCSSEQSRMWR